MKLSNLILILLFPFLCSGSVFAQSFDHPRGLIKSSEVAALREKVKGAPFQQILEGCKQQYRAIEQEGLWQKGQSRWIYKSADLALASAQIYLLTGEQKWALKSKNAVNLITNDTTIFLNDEAFGLARAQALLKVMMAYDYCFEAWDEPFRKWFSDQVYPVIFSLSATMSRHANYDMASNWMGVRYGTVLYASLVWDDYPKSPTSESGSKADALRFNAANRIEDFALANIHTDGWNVESLGYWIYGWNFVYPALIAWENQYGLTIQKFRFYERMVKAFQAGITAYATIQNLNTIGIKPDFSDDGTAMNSTWMPYAYRLTYDSSKQATRYFMEELTKRKDWASSKDGAFEYILFANTDDPMVEAMPPAYHYFYSPGQGALVIRNQIKDENDIIVAFSATSHRRGHQGSDNLSFRIIGLDNIWAVGAGRTNLSAGQTSFFPEKPIPDTTRYIPTLSIVDSVSIQEGLAYISASGSCTGVVNHQRQFQVEMDNHSAKITITDNSDNGKVWRLNTPEFNSVDISDQGFEITGPNGAKMIARITTPFDRIETGEIRYGGTTTQHNYGIYFHGDKYMSTKYIDIHCDKGITVELILAP